MSGAREMGETALRSCMQWWVWGGAHPLPLPVHPYPALSSPTIASHPIPSAHLIHHSSDPRAIAPRPTFPPHPTLPQSPRPFTPHSET